MATAFFENFDWKNFPKVPEASIRNMAGARNQKVLGFQKNLNKGCLDAHYRAPILGYDAI